MPPFQPAVRPLNTFAGGSVALDRLNNERNDIRKLLSAMSPPSMVFLVFDSQLNLLANADGKALLLVKHGSEVHMDLVATVNTPVNDRSWMFAGRVVRPQDDVDLPLDANIFAVILKDEQLGSYKDHERLQVRNFAISSPSDWLHSLVAHSRSVFEYYSRHACCGKCGQPTIVVKGGHELTCSDRDDCKTSCFPRSDPVVIMLVVDPSNDSCLLGRQARWPPGLHSCLAGFMEHGEAAEEAVAREVVEESSVVVGQARYHSSQPWPFPYSLMLGFVARATQTAIQVDPNELESARWFSRKEVKSMLQGSDDAYKLPPKGTIAHELCTAFATDDPITMFD
eukprot:TRINITY_DN6605_c0_g1_i3.p1 TRINITY_DN6605_c0_g1~~TRINITY_DN6605_c0_g1_i3.p1  ORF type:complete len:339 (+),score=42.97 TRINITY_DN6605_c0_g1_i3:51-1067(+)